MEVTSTTTANSTQSTTNVNSTKVDNETTKSLLFENLQDKQTDPKDITYEEYKELTRADIDKLYPKDTKKEQNDEATSLHIKANMTDDETMNRVLFDKELEALDSIDAEYLKSATGVFNAAFEAWTSVSYCTTPSSTGVSHVHVASMVQVLGEDDSFHNIVFDGNMMYEAKNSIKFSEDFSASQVMDTLGMIGTQYKMAANENQYEEETDFYKGVKAFEIYQNDIKNEYSKRTQNNDMILYTYTRGSIYSRISYDSYYNSIGKEQEIKYSNDEYQGRKNAG